jgi:hypothetical protein
MKMFLLDAGGAGIILLIPIAFIFLLFIWGLIEGFIINLFGINLFWRSVWHAVVVNIVSLIVGFIMIGVAPKLGLDEYTEMETTMKFMPTWIVFFAVSVLVEGLVLKALNRSKNRGKVFSASFVMNLFTYIILFAYAYYYL